MLLILFLSISILFSILSIYGICRIVHNSHKDVIRAYKRSPILLECHIVMGILLTMVIFITLCAFNNTFWHFKY